MRTVLIAAYYLLYGVVYAGWLFFESVEPYVFGYSRTYLGFLAIAATPFLLPPSLFLLRRILGKRRFTLTMISTIGSVAVAYLVSAQVYYHTRENHFDPYLQKAGQRFEAALESEHGNSLRIIAMGGSTTECGHLPPGQRYPYLLEKTLRARSPASGIEVLNAGVPTWTTKHSLINYVTYLRPLRPDIVIVMHAVNDAYRSFLPPEFTIGDYDEQWSHYYGRAIDAAAPPSFERWILRRPASTWYRNLVRATDYPLSDFVSLSAYRDHLTTLIDYLLADASKVVLVTQPSLYREDLSAAEEDMLVLNRMYFSRRTGLLGREYPNGRSLHRAMAAYNAVVAEIAEARGVALVDAAALIPRDEDHFVDDVHKTPESSLLLAQIIAEAIVDAGWLRRN